MNDKISFNRALQLYARYLLRKQRSRMPSEIGFCSRSKNLLLDNLKRDGVYKNERVRRTMLDVDRADFCAVNPYDDCPQPIGSNATISAPHMHAAALELLVDHLVGGNKALDIGSGSGYLTACMALMVGKTGKVIGIDHIKELVDSSIENVRKHHADLIDDGRIIMIEGDGRQGYEPYAPYNAIHVGAAAPTLPDKLVNQLSPGGRMLIPVGTGFGDQKFLQIDKDNNGQVTVQELMSVIYVPLTDKNYQLGRFNRR